ncbi:PTS-dependent dihydroxyacetone kinase, dihydroxyacetone-binding subunit DhaK [Corynebacterium occultum]|uniref:PTS-dependent dihydroxyacetone kinase, dihydroxyacetone-binding subunit DhaK n=1 Tax=Corynebacterium occultum TaxID=2675219 RepID=A0A6B8W6D3_9CORY|nr:PTS-dependent dihydroxyacetone kinase, dihydroxyacetone-binding subunit DhaK [Corynebacterium occultum]
MPTFHNDPEDFLPEALGGLIAAHPDAVWNEAGFISRRSPTNERVAVISGGGSGHEPLHAGFIGAGMLDAAVPGHMFTSPNAIQITEATRYANGGAGVVQVVKNYTGDVLNFRVSRQALTGEVETRQVLVDDDVATEDEDGPGRRGTGATILVEKICGAAAARGHSLERVTDMGNWVAHHSRSMAVALAPGHLPTAARPTFDLPEGEMEIGVGIHGERGTGRSEAGSAREMVEEMLDRILPSLELNTGEEVVCVVNGLGGTTLLELNLIFRELLEQLEGRKVKVMRSLVGNFVTAVNMSGVSITISRTTPELTELYDDPTEAPAWPKLGRPQSHAPARIRHEETLPEGEENNWLSGFLSRVQGAIDDLSELDRKAGDGDFGANMSAALGDLELPLRGSNAEVLEFLSQRFLIRAGGTSGAILGTIFRELAAAEDLAEGLSQALEAVTELGGAQVGDRTLVDALSPAAERAAEVGGGDVEKLLSSCFEAAAEGARGTAELDAKRGRAAYVGEAAKGVVDPGSIVIAWLFGGSGELSEFNA